MWTLKFTRNPMYIAVIGVLLSEVILFKSLHLLIYLIMGIVVLHLFVVFYEEPKLRDQFGEDYQKYCKSVPRWMITSRPYKDD
jgi:protein-S-isoprenylcysteine O-methyltransferase Ste14